MRNLKILGLMLLVSRTCHGQTLAFNETKPQFGAVTIGETSVPKIISVSNIGSAPMFIIQIAATNDFAETSHCPIWLPEGSGCLVWIRFTPTAAGPRSGELRVTWTGGGKQTIALIGFGSLGTNHADKGTPQAVRADRTKNDEEAARELIDDKRFSFQALLHKNPADVANSARVFELTKDSERKLRIASILLSIGVWDPKYSDYLMDEAKKALAHDQDMPWPILYGEDGLAKSLNPALGDWCVKHQLSFHDAEKVQKYEIPVAWVYLSAAHDSRAYELLLKGLRSPNVMVAISAAHGLAILQDPRAINEMIFVGRNTQNEARFEIAKSLLYFPDPNAQTVAEELTPEKMKGGLELTRREIEARGLKVLLPW
jgi:hypothetical protein